MKEHKLFGGCLEKVLVFPTRNQNIKIPGGAYALGNTEKPACYTLLVPQKSYNINMFVT